MEQRTNISKIHIWLSTCGTLGLKGFHGIMQTPKATDVATCCKIRLSNEQINHKIEYLVVLGSTYQQQLACREGPYKIKRAIG